MLKKLVFDTTNQADSDKVGSYLYGADGTLITHTNISGKDGLDVNILNEIVVSATDFDIRDLNAAQDNVAISDGTDTLAINADGSLNITDNGNSLTVDAVDLDIRNLVFATDKVDVSGSSITVSATDLDIRNLDYTLDNVALKGSTGNQLVVNADGSLNVNADISVVNGSDKAEDAASASGDIGTYILSVRQNTLAASTSTDGDYQSFKTDALGRLYTVDAGQSSSHAAISVTSTATDIVGTDLANRQRIIVQNNSSMNVYLGNSASVTTANGIILNPGAVVEMEIGAGINLHGITASGSADVRYFEIA